MSETNQKLIGDLAQDIYVTLVTKNETSLEQAQGIAHRSFSLAQSFVTCKEQREQPSVPSQAKQGHWPGGTDVRPEVW